MKVKYYTPVVSDGKSYFSVNGATNKSRDESIRLTKQHVSFKDPKTGIIRIIENEVWED